LSNKNNFASFPNRGDDDVRVRLETRASVVTGQIDRDGFVSSRANERHSAMPIPSHAAGSWDKNK
jgi:hypothetical protein